MKEKPMSGTTGSKPTERAAAKDGRDGKKDKRPQTRRRIRKIVERHRETFDDLAK